MIQIWQKTDKGNILISVQSNMDNAKYFCEKNRLKDEEIKLVKVIDG